MRQRVLRGATPSSCFRSVGRWMPPQCLKWLAAHTTPGVDVVVGEQLPPRHRGRRPATSDLGAVAGIEVAILGTPIAAPSPAELRQTAVRPRTSTGTSSPVGCRPQLDTRSSARWSRPEPRPAGDGRLGTVRGVDPGGPRPTGLGRRCPHSVRPAGTHGRAPRPVDRRSRGGYRRSRTGEILRRMPPPTYAAPPRRSPRPADLASADLTAVGLTGARSTHRSADWHEPSTTERARRRPRRAPRRRGRGWLDDLARQPGDRPLDRSPTSPCACCGMPTPGRRAISCCAVRAPLSGTVDPAEAARHPPAVAGLRRNPPVGVRLDAGRRRSSRLSRRPRDLSGRVPDWDPVRRRTRSRRGDPVCRGTLSCRLWTCDVVRTRVRHLDPPRSVDGARQRRKPSSDALS